ncbi:hypothetical protein BC833DRAFT_608398 [Globomyces pollinis-pini]|nr:hypothetical protein BC833DRAFT_608398 [Globomyces pollinis-pini]
MAPRKSIPESKDSVRNRKGITFSFSLAPSLPRTKIARPALDRFYFKTPNPLHLSNLVNPEDSPMSPPLTVADQSDKKPFTPTLPSLDTNKNSRVFNLTSTVLDVTASSLKDRIPIQLPSPIQSPTAVGYQSYNNSAKLPSPYLLPEPYFTLPPIRLNNDQGSRSPPRSPLKAKKEKTVGRKRKLTYVESSISCFWCQTNKTAQWRKGPKGSRTLCNACGLEWSKMVRQCGSEHHVGPKVAEMMLIREGKISRPDYISIVN